MTNPHQTFKGARSKAQWAKHHVHKLVGEYHAILDSDFAQLTIEDDLEPGQKRIKAVRITEFPPSIPLIIGDAVHNLRTAFDYIVVEITGLDWIALPVGKTPDDVWDLPRFKKIETTKPDLAKFIIDEIQPYQRGQFLLWELSWLDRIDKHRLILPTSNQAHRLGVELEDESGKRTANAWFSIGDNFATTQTFRGRIKIHNEGYSALSVRFGPETPFKDQPVLETLDRLSELALQAIERFERFHFGAPYEGTGAMRAL
jgi:hypothetical protein